MCVRGDAPHTQTEYLKLTGNEVTEFLFTNSEGNLFHQLQEALGETLKKHVAVKAGVDLVAAYNSACAKLEENKTRLGKLYVEVQPIKFNAEEYIVEKTLEALAKI